MGQATIELQGLQDLLYSAASPQCTIWYIMHQQENPVKEA